jgi:hypothetical protein
VQTLVVNLFGNLHEEESVLSSLSSGKLLKMMILNAFDEENNSSPKVTGYCP